ncbi:MAG: lamin tail domain-containing protein [Chloroflexota bacterium]|nr:lamin tail domain-containing protein [Chloroflexota bacterium]
MENQGFSVQLRAILAVLLMFTGTILPIPAAAAPLGTASRPLHSPQSQAIVVNEFLASNQNDLLDEDGDSSDWIELFNPMASPVDLTGWALTDNAGDLDKWVLPARILDANQYLVIFASGKDRTPASGQLHTNFKLSASGEYLALLDNAIPRQVVDQFSPQFPTQYGDVSYGRYDAAGEYRYFSHPTPGSANDTGSAYLGVVADVNYSVSRGYYDSTQFTVELQTSTPGASIRHSRSGLAPDATSGAVYNGPVSIYDSMPLRAVAHKSGYLESHVGTHTYLMPARIMQQPADPVGFPSTWGAYPADYEMDPTVVYDYSDTLPDDLRSLPALTISASRADLFDPVTGIYANPVQSGMEWERPASVELINPDGSTAFQIDAGLRIHGNSTRQPDVTPKHSFRLHFRGDYGASVFEYPLFPDSPVDTFEKLVLYALLDDGWILRGERALYVRNPWVGGTETAMGRLAAHYKPVHLYLDGLYWGLYAITERIDGDFAASYFGGNEDDFDVIYDVGVGIVRAVNGDTVAWNAMMDLAEAGLADPARYQAVQEYLDLADLSDFMLVHIYSGNTIPWKDVDWKAIRRRAPGETFDFLCWDNGSFLESAYLDDSDVGSGADDGNTPAYLYWRLRDNPEFRLLFADRVHRHFFNGGVFYVDPANPSWDPAHPERNLPAYRLTQLTDLVDRAVVPESARWGDVVNPGTSFNRDDDWVIEHNRMLNEFFPQRSAIVLQQLHYLDLYPAVQAPSFNQHGGSVPPDFQLTITAPEGLIYFTTDGSDPRIPISGTVSPAATLYTAPVFLPAGTSLVKARVLSGDTWSALNEATFLAPQGLSTLKVTEIMYNPAGGSDYEFIELQNIGPTTLDLSGVQIRDGIDFTFPPGASLAPSQFAVLVNDSGFFPIRYPGIPMAGQFDRNLANEGENLDFFDPVSGTIFMSVRYHDDEEPGWPEAPDGVGYSLVIVDPNGDPNAGSNWRASTFPNGSPGEEDPLPFDGGVLINELLAHSDAPFEDAIELINPTGSPIDVGGWFLSDDNDTLKKYRIPNGTTIPANGFYVFYEYQFNPTPGLPPSFALSADGERLFLSAAQPDGTLIPYSTGVRFGPSETNRSMGRYPTSTGVDFVALSRSTFGVENPASLQQFRTGTGAPNGYPLVGPVVFNELMYHPAPGALEYIELLNITDSPIPLFDPVYPGNTWRLTDGIDFAFPPAAMIPARGLALVVDIDPILFAGIYNVPAEVPVFGPYDGSLSNGGEGLTLARPDTPVAGIPPYIPVDRILYSDSSPWPGTPDGSGPSLERLSGPTYANDPVTWHASAVGGTPGLPNDACYFADLQPNADHTSPASCDSDVDVADIQRVTACWNQPIGTAGCPATFNVDGLGAYVTVGDLIATATRWGWR